MELLAANSVSSICPPLCPDHSKMETLQTLGHGGGGAGDGELAQGVAIIAPAAGTETHLGLPLDPVLCHDPVFSGLQKGKLG